MLSTVELDKPLPCPVLQAFLEGLPPAAKKVATARAGAVGSDDITALRRLLYLLEVTTGVAVFAGCKVGRVRRVANTLVMMRESIGALRSASTVAEAANTDAFMSLARETGVLFSVCTADDDEFLSLCGDVFEYAAAIDA
jgi:hypothetical protein